MKITCMVGAMAVAVAAFGAFEREAPEKYWDLKELSKTPEYRVSPYKESDYAGMKALLVKGKGPKDSAAEFFCYYAVPEGTMPAGGWPGVVLVHGGGGTAFPQYVEMWRKLGFAVIAQDWYNRRPAPGLANAAPTEVNVPRVDLEGGYRQDHVANVANMVLAHSLIRSFPEVNKDRTVFVGLSWGSWYGACVAAVDDRFKGVVEIYCGDKNVDRDPKSHLAFINGRFLHAAKVPMWWAVSTNDQNVKPKTTNAGFEECANFDGCALVIDLPHSHCGFTFRSVQRMAAYYAGMDRRLPKLSDAVLSGGELSARIVDPGKGVKFAKLAYSVSEHPVEYKRAWRYADAEISGDTIRAKVPAGTRACFLAAYEGKTSVNDLCGTTRFVFPEVKALELPGESGTKAAMSCAPFPDRISAYVWRNWFVVPHRRLADTVAARESDLEEIAAQMGLPKKVDVLPEWYRKGYITVLRRNWHLLDYPQLMELVGMTREKLRFSLMEDDFLWIKMGSVKPKCGTLLWSAGMREQGRGKRESIARILREEGIDPNAPEEPRFSFLKELATTSQTSQASQASQSSPFDFRIISSYCAEYCDPLADPEVGSFPEGLLQKLSAEGVNAVWLHTVLRTLVKDPKYPEFGEGCENRLANLQKLVDRCRRYGIRVFIYTNEPRGLDPSFFRVPGREKLAGATHNELQAMCTLNPETQRWLSDSLEKVFSTVHGLGGIFTITASENLTNCATRPGNKETCPVCRSHSRAEIIAAANNAMIRGMKKGDPKAEALVYKWAWPTDEEEEIVSRLPKDGVRLLAVSERAIEIHRGGVKVQESDYSISIVGPGENAKRAWGFAKKRGMPIAAKVQAANSWEFSAFPYIPTMDLVAQHASNLANEGVGGVMLAWSLGGYPCANLSVYHELRKGETDKEGVLNRLAKRLYGDKAPQARKAWTAFSEGFANYPFSCGTIYVGPHHWGVANPLYAEKTGYSATMVGIPYDHLDGWRTAYPRETYAELIGKVADGFAEGCRLMDGVADRKELDMFRAEQMHFASCRDQSLFIIARDTGDREGMRRYAKAELDRAKDFLPILRADSRIGFESSCQYFFTPVDVIEKILSCRAILDNQL